MCGIFGFVSSSHSEELNVQNLYDGLELIRHRGPDGEGGVVFMSDGASGISLISKDTPELADSAFTLPSWFPTTHMGEGESLLAAKIALGHRRLSIIDLSPYGHQPMSYKESRYWITYNGEIYNYIELRDELIGLGHHFESFSDTEVILAAYAEWGKDCVKKFNGMWAFALYDTQEKILFLSRDRFGVKPLYYWISQKGHLFFASEIKQFTVMPDWSAYINHQRAYDFLAWGVIDHTDETLFKGVYQLPPGHIAILHVGHSNTLQANEKLISQQWYVLPSSPNYKGTFAQAIEDMRSTFEDSIALRLRADVPVGSCLSGGIDSSSIVCVMARLLEKMPIKPKQKTFSALASDEKLDESKWIQAVIDKVHPEPHFVTPDLAEMISTLSRLTWHQDEPFGSTSIFAQWKVFELAAKHNVRVMLDGQGADEQLLGYHWTLHTYLAHLLVKGKCREFVNEVIGLHRKLGYSYSRIIILIISTLLPQFLQNYLRSIATGVALKPKWIGKEFLNKVRAKKPSYGIKSMSGICYDQMTSSNLPMLLHWEDRDSMAHSVEARVPFLDFRFVELSMRLKDSYKYKSGITKRVLRESVKDVIPEMVYNRMNKIGFATSEEEWLRLNKETFQNLIASAIKNSNGILTSDCTTYLNQILDGVYPFNFAVWRIINFGEWMKLFSVKIEGQ